MTGPRSPCRGQRIAGVWRTGVLVLIEDAILVKRPFRKLTDKKPTGVTGHQAALDFSAD